MDFPLPPPWVLETLRAGLVIPAHPLALTPRRAFDERRQVGLTRYYHAAGAGGVAVGVHTTQFEIRDPRHGLLEPVLGLAATTARGLDASSGRRTVLIAGVCGQGPQALEEARLARRLGYHVALLSLAALPRASEEELLRHCRAVAAEIALMGFYLQPAVGGRPLPLAFWRGFAEIPNAVAVKVAPFDRYRTLEVARAVAEAGRSGEIALYTGNDDHILLDLLADMRLPGPRGPVRVRFAGGLLGQWAVWTRQAVRLFEECRQAREAGQVPAGLLTRALELTDANAAVFDAAGGFAGCLPGIQEVLRRQGLLETNLCLDPRLGLSPGQAEEIDRVQRAYPHLQDDAFVAGNLAAWLSASR